MKELFYFSNSDLMIQVQNSKTNNSLQYTSHRELTRGERELVERYLRNNFSKSVYNVTNLDYLGINRQLERNLSQLQINKARTQNAAPANRKAEKAVKNLIAQTMSAYYFEKIGDTLMRMKKDPDVKKNLSQYKSELLDLISAYNIHSEQKVTLTKLLPKEPI